MNESKKELEVGSSKVWKNIIACIYYLFCLILIIFSFSRVPQIEANMYDIVIYKTSKILSSLAFLIPAILVFNDKIKEKLPLLKNKKWWSDVFGFIIVFVILIGCSGAINLLHSKDYKTRYEQFNKSEISQDEFEENLEQDNNTSQINLIKLHYLDVGQGDSTFIELPNEKTMLIDAGQSSKGVTVSSYITDLGYSKIDYVIGTHPHADHIGGLAYIIDNFEIENIFLPKAESNSKTYENMLNTIIQNGLKITTAKSGVNIVNDGILNINIIAPNGEFSDLNNNSAVVKISYGNRKFLFMGDAEIKSENDITSDVSADVIKVGHHGSDTSSGESFVNKVNAEYAIIMVGNYNQYNHPDETIIDRWISSGAKIYRTDVNGNIVVISDGYSLEINSSWIV